MTDNTFDDFMASFEEQELVESVSPEDHFAQIDPTKEYPYAEFRQWRNRYVWYCGSDGACIHTSRDYAVAHKADVDRRKELPNQIRVTVAYTYTPNYTNYPEGTTTVNKAIEVDSEQCPDVDSVLELMQDARDNGDSGFKVEWGVVYRWDKNR